MPQEKNSETIFRYLSENRDAPGNVSDHAGPRVCALFAKTRNCLPDILIPENNLLYIGISRSIDPINHFNANNSGFRTPRRSLGAILKEKLGLEVIPRGSGNSDRDCQNYRFTKKGECRLTKWMLSNLEYSVHAYDGDLKGMQKQLISNNKPPLNLTNWQNPQGDKIKALRTICREEAKQFNQA